MKLKRKHMKIDKEKKKELKDLIKSCAKTQKMKHVSSSFYNVYDNFDYMVYLGESDILEVVELF